MDGIAFGRGIVALRRRRGWRQADLAARARLSKSVVARVEQGRAAKVAVETLDRIAAALDARVSCRLLWQGEGLDRLLDADHAEVVEVVVRTLTSGGWLVATEVTFNIYGDRGSIDVLAFHPGTGALLMIEVKSVVPDVQATLGGIDRKVRHAPTIARERGWSAGSVSSLLVIRDARTARRRIDTHAATFGNAFPDRNVAVRRWLASPDPKHALRGIWFVTTDRHTVPRRGATRQARMRERGGATDS